MKTKEFIKKVESLGLEVHDFSRRLEVRLCGRTHAIVSKDNKYFGIKEGVEDLIHRDKLTLLKLLIEYSETPIEEREEPKKYYLRLPEMFDSDLGYMNYEKDDNCYFFSDMFTTDLFQTQFTQEEIDNLPNQDFIKTLIKEEV